jgi:large subunit ribosomal protein L31
MKADIHPNYSSVNVTCNCGNEFSVSSTMRADSYRVDVCNKCHPFYTGKHKILDTEGRVDQFMRRYGASQTSKQQDGKES